METSKIIHPFEKSGLGMAPFRLTDYYQNKAGGSCNHCGMWIKHVFVISDKNGIQFDVGSSCVEKTDFNLYLDAKKLRTQYLKDLRAERATAEYKAFREKEAEKQQERLAEFNSKYPEIFAFLESNKFSNAFYESLYNAIKTYGQLSSKQEYAILEAMKPKVISQHVGEIGQKMIFNLTLKAVFSFSGLYGLSFIYNFQDEVGNTIVYKGSKEFDRIEKDGMVLSLSKGDKIKLEAKIKAHSEYKGSVQTIIERPKQK